jgi:ubiquinone/menaquinone biosynthesis C-methylase UbiE
MSEHTFYDRLFRFPYGCHYDPGNRAARRHVLACVTADDLARPGLVLDVGAGVADLVEPLLARGVPPDRILLVEYAWRTLQVGRGWLESRAPGVRYVQGDAMRLPFADGAAAVVFCREVLEHVADDGPTLREFWRVLRPGGLAVLTVPLERQPNPRWGHLRCYTLPVLCHRLLATGAWQIETATSFGRLSRIVWLYPKYVLYAAWLAATGRALARLRGKPVPSYYATRLHQSLVMPLFDRLLQSLARLDRSAAPLPPANLLIAARRPRDA